MSDLDHKDPRQKTVLISGATSGFGRDTALMLAENGYRVFAGFRDQKRGEDLLKKAKERSWPLSIIHLDMTDSGSLRHAVDSIIKDTGRIDILINNAGYGLAGSVEDLERDEIRAQFETNVFGHVELTKFVIPHMRRERSGIILSISSMAGRLSYPLFSAYCASKHALEAFGESLRYELRPFGITSVLIEPGVFRTGFVKKNLAIGKNVMQESSPYYKAAKEAHEEYSKEDDTAPGPETVTRLILKILRTPRPRLSYRAGQDSKIAVLMKKILPESWFEVIFSKYLGVDRYRE
jgi:NAD(P)-dependent dehydrogenase (short-subunit alcohol dehydrogenase family)